MSCAKGVCSHHELWQWCLWLPWDVIIVSVVTMSCANGVTTSSLLWSYLWLLFNLTLVTIMHFQSDQSGWAFVLRRYNGNCHRNRPCFCYWLTILIVTVWPSLWLLFAVVTVWRNNGTDHPWIVCAVCVSAKTPPAMMEGTFPMLSLDLGQRFNWKKVQLQDFYELCGPNE